MNQGVNSFFFFCSHQKTFISARFCVYLNQTLSERVKEKTVVRFLSKQWCRTYISDSKAYNFKMFQMSRNVCAFISFISHLSFDWFSSNKKEQYSKYCLLHSIPSSPRKRHVSSQSLYWMYAVAVIKRRQFFSFMQTHYFHLIQCEQFPPNIVQSWMWIGMKATSTC